MRKKPSAREIRSGYLDKIRISLSRSGTLALGPRGMNYHVCVDTCSPPNCTNVLFQDSCRIRVMQTWRLFFAGLPFLLLILHSQDYRCFSKQNVAQLEINISKVRSWNSWRHQSLHLSLSQLSLRRIGSLINKVSEELVLFQFHESFFVHVRSSTQLQMKVH